MNPLVGCTLTALLLAVHASCGFFVPGCREKQKGKPCRKQTRPRQAGRRAKASISPRSSCVAWSHATDGDVKKVMALTSAGVFVDAMEFTWREA